MQDDLQRYYLFNNGFTDEEALNYAISQSLDTEVIPPSRRHLDDSFPNYENVKPDPVSEKIQQVFDMIKNAREKINELVNIDLSANSLEESRSESQKIIEEQNVGYQEALNQAQLKEKEDEENKKLEEERKRKEEEKKKEEETKDANEKANYEKMIKQKYREMGEQPKNGILLAVSLPNGSRIKRVFSQESIGDDVYVWVAADEQMISSGIQYKKFKLVCGKDLVLNDKKSLLEQKISSRTIFIIQY